MGITEKEAKKMDDYICVECKRGQQGSTEELYCICQTPYDESQWVPVICVWINRSNLLQTDMDACEIELETDIQYISKLQLQVLSNWSVVVQVAPIHL